VTTARPLIAPRVAVHARPRGQRQLALSWPHVRLRTLTRLVLALILLSFVPVLIVTDLTGRSEIRHVDRNLATAQLRLFDTRTAVVSSQEESQSTRQEIATLKRDTGQTQASLTNTNTSIATADVGIFYAGVAASVLDGCLAGVTKALDQVAVGQDGGAFAALVSVASSCNAIKP
jgi:hypothetical protein